MNKKQKKTEKERWGQSKLTIVEVVIKDLLQEMGSRLSSHLEQMI